MKHLLLDEWNLKPENDLLFKLQSKVDFHLVSISGSVYKFGAKSYIPTTGHAFYILL